MYKHLQLTTNPNKKTIVLQANVGEELEKKLDNFRTSEIFTILNDEIRTTMNMVPCNMSDIMSLNFHSSDYDPL